MPRRIEKKKETNSLFDALKEIQMTNSDPTEEKNKKEIADIMTFCNSPELLNLPASRFILRDSQRIILKCFYAGTKGNEDLKLDQKDWEWLYSQEEDEEYDDYVYKKNIKSVIKKMLKKEKDKFNFSELNLVLGRRGGKTILASVISAYEVYKLLVIGGGDPHEYYDLPADDEIAVINVALSEKQAGRLFTHIQSRLRNSPFFKNRIAKETTTEIRLYTDSDLKKKNSETALSVPGSILILCGHSNPDSLAGYNAILILFDELAFYDDTGKVTGEYFYTRLKPSLSHFYEYGDGRLVEISSPNSDSGVFYRIHKEAEEFDDILSFQLPTWCANPQFSFNHRELVRDRKRNPEAFAIEYGAQWARSGIYGSYFPDGLVDRAVEAGMDAQLHPLDYPLPGFNYYIHVDAANGGDRYVAVLVGSQRYTDIMGNKRWRCVLGNVWIWNPVPNVGLEFNTIDKDVLAKCRTFRPLCVTYDQWNSIHSIQMIRSHGFVCKQTSFNNAYKHKIYQNLTEMMSYSPQPELWLYDDPNLILEMKCLKKRKIKRGISIITDKNGEIKTDDVIDCLAGATSMASGNVIMPLPAPVSVYTGYR